MIKILIRTRTKWESAEAAGSSNFNKGFLSWILQASSSLSVLFPHSVHFTAFCHPSLVELHFPLPHSPRVSSGARALASATARVLSRQKSSKWRAKCGWLRRRQTLRKRRVHLLWYTDRWWLVCLPVLHLARINPIYSPVALTTNSGLWRTQTMHWCMQKKKKKRGTGGRRVMTDNRQKRRSGKDIKWKKNRK